MRHLPTMKPANINCDPELIDMFRREAQARMMNTSDLLRLALAKWLINQRLLKQEQVTDTGRLIPDDRMRRAKAAKRKKADNGTGDEAPITIDARVRRAAGFTSGMKQEG